MLKGSINVDALTVQACFYVNPAKTTGGFTNGLIFLALRSGSRFQPSRYRYGMGMSIGVGMGKMSRSKKLSYQSRGRKIYNKINDMD